MIATYRLGGQIERASAVRPVGVPISQPVESVRRQDVRTRMRRPNPQVPASQMSSIVAGGNFLWNASDVKTVLDIEAEAPVVARQFGVFCSDDHRRSECRFRRSALRATALAPTPSLLPGTRRRRSGGAMSADQAPLGTIEPLLILGGDELLFLENRYIIPVPVVKVPFVGSPTVTFRHILGSAGVKHLPGLTQILGMRLSVTLLRTEGFVRHGGRKVEIQRWIVARSLILPCPEGVRSSTLHGRDCRDRHRKLGQSMKTLAVIPARLGATRLPRKPLRLLGGVPLVLRVWERVREIGVADDCVIATDSAEVASVAAEYGADVVADALGSPVGHRSRRRGRRAQRVPALPVHPQRPGRRAVCLRGGAILGRRAGDRRALSPRHGRGRAVRPPSSPIPTSSKVVGARDGRAMYFSRAPIPFCANRPTPRCSAR